MTVQFYLQGLIVLLLINAPSLNASNTNKSGDFTYGEKYVLPAVDKTHLEKQLHEVEIAKEKIPLLGELAGYYVDWEGNYFRADSLLNVGIEIAELSYDYPQLLEAYSNYLLVMDDYNYSNSISEVIDKLESFSSQLREPVENWKCKIALAKGYLLVFKMEQARDLAYQALTTAIQLKDQQMTVKTHLVVGEIQQKMTNNVEAIRNFLDALTIAESSQDVVLRMECYKHLSNFYNLLKAYDKSIQYKLKELDIAENAIHPDSIRTMSIKYDLEIIAFNNRTLNEKQLYKIIDFAKRNNIPKLNQNGIALFRTHLIKQNDFAQLFTLFHSKYPEELEKIRINDTTTYFRLQAFFLELEGDIDSARTYYEMAALRLDQSKDKLRKSSFYLRYGDFLQRSAFPQEAIEQYMRAYELLSSIPYFEFMLEATGKMEKLYLLQNDFANAYKFIAITQNIKDSLQNEMQKGQLQLMEIENEETLREQKLLLEKEETRRQHNIQYTAITIIIATAFILLVVLGGLNVSPTMIRMVGFLSFIFFFEFLILLFDTWIHHLTHGEPWKILAIKILLMCGLLPLHHIIEKKVTHYLIHHDIKWIPKKIFRFRKSKPVDQ